jgi:hypothetical protein
MRALMRSCAVVGLLAVFVASASRKAQPSALRPSVINSASLGLRFITVERSC